LICKIEPTNLVIADKPDTTFDLLVLLLQNINESRGFEMLHAFRQEAFANHEPWKLLFLNNGNLKSVFLSDGSRDCP